MLLVLLVMLLASCASRKVIQINQPRKPEKTPPVAAVSPGDKLIPARQDELGELRALLASGDYQKVIESGQIYVKKSRTADALRQAFEILADAYCRVPLPVEAADAYCRALEKSSGPDSARILRKLEDVVSQLAVSDVLNLAARLESSQVKAEILLPAGRKYLELGNPEDAYRVLTVLTEQCPKQEAAAQALGMIQDIKTHPGYERHAIGCLLPLTGTYETYGKKALKGIELAQNQFALLHPDPPLTSLVKDTESDPQKTIEAVKELAESGVAAIIGPVATADIAAAEAQKYGIPIITLTQKDQITRIGALVFRNFMTPRAQTEALASFTIKKLGLSCFAVLYPDEPYGMNFMNLFKDQIESAGGRVVAVQSYDPMQTDFRETLQKLTSRYSPVPDDSKSSGAGKRLGPAPEAPDATRSSSEEFEALFIPDSPQKLAVIVPQLAYGNLRPSYLLGTNLWHAPKLIHSGGPSVQGSILPDGFFAESKSETIQQFVRIFQNAYKESPGYIEAVSYDTAMMVFQIVGNPDTLFRSSIIKELLRPDGYSGVTGNYCFDKDREVQKKLFLLQIKGEEFIEITPH